jgi:crotonobetaine/carnitine-CoA ligase
MVREYWGNQRTLGYMLHDIAKDNLKKVFVFFKEEKVTYGELDEGTNRIANALLAMGVKKGDRVAVMLPNCTEFVFVQFAVAKAGAIQTPLNTGARERQLTHFINNSSPEILIIDQQYLPILKGIEDTIEHLPKLVVVSRTPQEEKITFRKSFDMTPFQKLFEGSPELPKVEVKRIDPVDILYTSGTTGLPKGVLLSHNHHWLFAALYAEMGKLSPQDIMYTYLPYFHGLSQMMCTLPALMAEASIALSERFSASRFWDEVRKYGATTTQTLFAIPSILMKQPERPNDADHPMKFMFCSGISPEIAFAFQKRFNVMLLNQFGMTESHTIAYAPYGEFRLGAVGPINKKYFEVRIVDEEDEEVARGAVGEIISRARQPHTQMIGYWKNPEATLEMFKNQWLHSGDLGYLDENQWLHFVGRKKEGIRRRGEFISPSDVESEITMHPSVDECAAIAVPSELGEDDVKVVIVLKKGATLSPPELFAFCKEKMPKYMVPRYIEIKEALPKTETERVQKVKLKEEGITPNTWDSEKAQKQADSKKQ